MYQHFMAVLVAYLSVLNGNMRNGNIGFEGHGVCGREYLLFIRLNILKLQLNPLCT